MILIHVGLPKCGSTTLQAGLFSQHPELLLFRPKLNNPARTKIASDIISSIMQKHTSFNKNEASIAVKQMEEYAQIRNKTPILSAEGLSSTRYIGIKKKTERLAHLFKEKKVKLLLVLREPLGLIKSTFYQDLINYRSHGNTKDININRWLGNLINAYEAEDDGVNNFLNTLNYFDLWRRYQKHFGINNIETTTLEKLANNESAFYSEICSFYGIRNFLPIKITASNVTSNKVIRKGFTVDDELTGESISRIAALFSSQFDQLKNELGLTVWK